MSPSPYTEGTLVQQTTAEYLEERLGWESVYAHNTEDFGRTACSAALPIARWY